MSACTHKHSRNFERTYSGPTRRSKPDGATFIATTTPHLSVDVTITRNPNFHWRPYQWVSFVPLKIWSSSSRVLPRTMWVPGTRSTGGMPLLKTFRLRHAPLKTLKCLLVWKCYFSNSYFFSFKLIACDSQTYIQCIFVDNVKKNAIQ